jgi:zinc D-Ala-D-Ala carboxypeptidase
MHIDLGPARQWGERFPDRAMPFVEETPPVRETLAASRTLHGTGAAGMATVGAAGVEVAQEVLAEAQGAVLALVPYLGALRWVFITLALGGIALAVWARVDDWRHGLR